MPHLDFRQAFASSQESAPSPVAPAHLFRDPLVIPSPEEMESARFRVRLGHSEWTNITFVTIASLGGLMCAFYFFNGADVLRAAAAWPREFLYPRPTLSASHVVGEPKKQNAQPTDAAVATTAFLTDTGKSSSASRVSDFGSLLTLTAIDSNRTGSVVSSALPTTAEPSLPFNSSTLPAPPVAEPVGVLPPANSLAIQHTTLVPADDASLHSLAGTRSAALKNVVAKTRQASSAVRKKSHAKSTATTQSIKQFTIQSSDQLVSILQTSAQSTNGSTAAVVRPTRVSNRSIGTSVAGSIGTSVAGSIGTNVAGSASGLTTYAIPSVTSTSGVTNSALGGVHGTVSANTDLINSTVSGLTGRLGGR